MTEGTAAMNTPALMALGRFGMAIGMFLMSRMNERSTWAVGVPAALTVAGINLEPGQAEAIATLGIAAAGAFGVLVPDGKIVDLAPLDRGRTDVHGDR
jgi:hypothetical protein